MNYFCAFGGEKFVLRYFLYFQMIEYCRMKLEYLKNGFFFQYFLSDRINRIFRIKSTFGGTENFRITTLIEKIKLTKPHRS